MYSDEEPEPGPSSSTNEGRKRKRTATTTSTESPRSLKRVATAATDSSVTSSDTESDVTDGEHALDNPQNWNPDEEEEGEEEGEFGTVDGVDEDIDQVLQYIDVPESTSTSTPSLPLDSLPQSPSPQPAPSTSTSHASHNTHIPPEPPSSSQHAAPDFLSEYTCPICFSPPTNATLTLCGHICCGSCLFTAVKTTLHRGAVGFSREPNVARCPVCRAPIPGWDGRGGGVIGLKTRVVISL